MIDLAPAPWFRALLYQQSIGLQALTLPMLVAVRRCGRGDRPGGPVSPDEFRQLLEALRTEVPADFVVRLAECDRLGQPVATPIRRENYWRADADRHFAKEEAGMPSLIVEPRPTYGVGEGFDALEAALWRLLQLPLQEGRLSYRSGGYRALCDEDLEFVRAATSLDLGHEV